MISFASMWAIVIRHMRVLRRDLNTALFGFYWPICDILIWGFLGVWIEQSRVTEFHNYKVVALLGILLWQLVGRGCNFMMAVLIEELWSHNIVNLFSLPLRIAEWIAGTIVFYILMISLTSLFCMGAIFIFYDVPMMDLFSTFLLFAPPLLLCGIWIGFTCLQIIVMMGKRGIELGFVLGWFLLPFSGAYYPVEVLPAWGQTVSTWLPMSYVFQGMRRYVMHNEDPTSYLIKGYVLSILYAVTAILLFVYCFNRSKQKGLARLAD